MSTETAVEEHKTEEWGGADVSPLKASYGKLMMWFLIVSDSFSFAALLISYAALRMSEEWWP
ncbi:MAG: cytochrome oxidase subunit III, partial [Chitinophagales bacterium]